MKKISGDEDGERRGRKAGGGKRATGCTARGKKAPTQEHCGQDTGGAVTTQAEDEDIGACDQAVHYLAQQRHELRLFGCIAICRETIQGGCWACWGTTAAAAAAGMRQTKGSGLTADGQVKELDFVVCSGLELRQEVGKRAAGHGLQCTMGEGEEARKRRRNGGSASGSQDKRTEGACACPLSIKIQCRA